jgi:sphinganine-1-phosphate aldolase
MTHLGQSGYAQSCEVIVGAARRLKTALHQDPVLSADLYVLGDPLVSVVAFGSNTVNIYAVGDAMGKKGWHLNALADPAALHLAVTVCVLLVPLNTRPDAAYADADRTEH